MRVFAHCRICQLNGQTVCADALFHLPLIADKNFEKTAVIMSITTVFQSPTQIISLKATLNPIAHSQSQTPSLLERKRYFHLNRALR